MKTKIFFTVIKYSFCILASVIILGQGKAQTANQKMHPNVLALGPLPTDINNAILPSNVPTGNAYINRTSIGRSGTANDYEFGYNVGFTNTNNSYTRRITGLASSINKNKQNENQIS